MHQYQLQLNVISEQSRIFCIWHINCGMNLGCRQHVPTIINGGHWRLPTPIPQSDWNCIYIYNYLFINSFTIFIHVSNRAFVQNWILLSIHQKRTSSHITIDNQTWKWIRNKQQQKHAPCRCTDERCYTETTATATESIQSSCTAATQLRCHIGDNQNAQTQCSWFKR